MTLHERIEIEAVAMMLLNENVLVQNWTKVAWDDLEPEARKEYRALAFLMLSEQKVQFPDD
jgi:hypothetical protein